MNRLFQRMQRSPVTVLGAIAVVGVGIGGVFDRLHAAPAASENRVTATTPAVRIANNKAIADLAAHLKKVGAKMYGAYWCPYCTRQKEMFGSAFREIDYVECDPRGENARPKLCTEAGVKGYPTWEVNGKTHVGVQSLEELANASNYKGSRNF